VKAITVALAPCAARSYEIHIGRDLLDTVAAQLAGRRWAARWFVVTDSNVAPLHLERVLARVDAEAVVLPAGEKHKTIDTAVALASSLLARGADRTSGILAVGGGVVGDVAGFVASIFMRGIPCVQLPTTLLAQVDSSVGGKTGVDVPAAKNILGTFHQPCAVFSDLAFLATLPAREWTNGFAEIVKYGAIADPGLLPIMAARSDDLRAGDQQLLGEVIGRSCRIKQQIVERDEREGGLRRILNFGHTVGHAVEAESGFSVSHGEAVSMGMVCAAALSARLGHLGAAHREELVDVLRRVGLPVRIPASLAVSGILERLGKDKKKAGTTIHFVLLKAPGQPFVAGDVPGELVREVIEDARS
jgi:3-dehydroquinate synthase